jgi:hypothetical protein
MNNSPDHMNKNKRSVLVFEGNYKQLKELQSMFQSGELEKLLGVPVLDVYAEPISQPHTPSTLLQQAVTAGINTALWLQDQIDEFARNLVEWQTPFPIAPAAPGWRFKGGFEDAIAFCNNTMQIPPQARGSSKKIEINGTRLELFAGTWLLANTSEVSLDTLQEWSLLLILRMQSGGFLPQGINLQVSDLTCVLGEQVAKIDDCYLIAPVMGNLADIFFVTISLDGEERELEPFFFAPEPSHPGDE